MFVVFAVIAGLAGSNTLFLHPVGVCGASVVAFIVLLIKYKKLAFIPPIVVVYDLIVYYTATNNIPEFIRSIKGESFIGI